MSEIVYERYKDALRRGHVAALRGRLDESLAAYREAAVLAHDRPLPRVSAGNVLVRLGRLQEAVAAYDAALSLSRRDETALTGRADALTRLGRRVDAADSLDLLAEVLEESGRVADACDTARRALELAESKGRRRHIEELTRTLRTAVGDQAAERALARALQVLEGTTSALPVVPGAPDAAAPEAGGGHLGAGAVAATTAEPTVEAPAPAPEPEVPDTTALEREVDDALDSGDLETARLRLIAAAVAHQTAGRSAAALDACYAALAIAPGDIDLHLLLVDLYLARGWRPLAADKLELLGRLLDLDADGPGRERLCSVISARFPDDARLAAICT